MQTLPLAALCFIVVYTHELIMWLSKVLLLSLCGVGMVAVFLSVMNAMVAVVP